ncbi:TraR/DksA family transcriptional regulator [Streptomyces sp. NPDC020141]|uniref:TraR/DksA family transcriptional regulator n=1 Tax=Streptomyces sp. NPDC020141 TaxID=3365065 RepID=UPI0037928380
MVAKKTAESDPASTNSTAAPAPAGDTTGPASTGATADGSAAGRAAPRKAAKKAAKKTAAEKAPAKKAARKAPAKKAAVKKTAAKKATPPPGETDGAAGETPARKTAAKKTAARKAAKKTAAKKTAAGKTAAKKAAPAAHEAAEAAQQTGARTVRAKKTAAAAPVGSGGTAVPTARAAATAPGELAVRPGEDPWTPEEVAEARTELEGEVSRLNAELTASEAALAHLMRDSGGGSGGDDADTGTKNITREHELSLAANAREMLEQTERALQRLEAGTYGVCENCGKPIGKARMQAFPRATLCVECKQKQERRG